MSQTAVNGGSGSQSDVNMTPTSTTAAPGNAPHAAAASSVAADPSAAAAAASAEGVPAEGLRRERMIIKLTTNLMNTYNAINDKYYANKRARIREQQEAAAAAAKKGLNAAAAAAAATSKVLYNDGHDDKDYNYIVQANEVLAERYVIDWSIGKGSFGRVVKAYDLQGAKYVAIKIIKSKSAFYKQAQIELKILMSLQADADKWNIVSVLDHFIHKNHQCFVFELLSLNLYELLKNTRFTGVSLKLIAKFGQQLLCTLGYLQSKERGDKRIIHCDLKPENILLRNCKKSAIVLCDFGSACWSNQKTYTYIQSRFYRAPEVLLSLGYNGAIDMWSLGCILVEMHTGKPLFDGQDEADQMVKQVEILGVPPRHMLERNAKADRFFEISQSTGAYRLKHKFNARLGGSLRAALGHKWEDTELYRQYLDLIQSMLIYDPLKRIRPSQALAHPFFAVVANIIAGENGGAAATVAAAAAGAKLTSQSSNPNGSGSGVATSLAPSANPGGDAQMVASPPESEAMDTSPGDPAAAAAAAADSQPHAAPASHSHHHHRSNSRKRPHSNPVLSASASAGLHQSIQPLEVQALLAQSKQQKQQASHASASASAAAAASAASHAAAASSHATAVPAPQHNNLMREDASVAAAAAASSSAAHAPSSRMEDSQPDVASTSIAPPVTPSKHGMVTRSAASGSGAKRDPLDIAKLAVASPGSSASNSGRSSPDQTPTVSSGFVVNDLETRSRGGSQLAPPDPSTASTASASAASSPKTTLHSSSAAASASGAVVPVLSHASSGSVHMVDIEPVPSAAASAQTSSPPSKTGSGGKGRRGRRGKKQQSASNSNPNASESETDGPSAGVGSRQLSRMSLDFDAAPAGPRTRSHAAQQQQQQQQPSESQMK